MDEHAVLRAQVAAHFARGLHERLGFDVADGAADLGDDHIDVVGGLGAHARLDLVGDVRDHLHALAEVFAGALLAEHFLVDLAGRDIRFLRKEDVEETLVVADVEIGLRAVLGHIDLTVLERVHRARVDVDVRIELLLQHTQATAAQQTAEGGSGKTLAKGGNDAAGDENVLGDVFLSIAMLSSNHGSSWYRSAVTWHGGAIPLTCPR